MTQEELNKQINDQLQEALVKSSAVIKTYVDAQDAALADELKAKIVEEISNVDGLEGKVETLNKVADTFTKFFDADENGEISPEELAAKFGTLQTSINEVSKRLDDNGVKLDSFGEALKQLADDFKARVDAVELNVSKNTDNIAKLKADVETNYLKKDEASKALEIGVGALVDAVKNVFSNGTTTETDNSTDNTDSTDSNSDDSSSNENL